MPNQQVMDNSVAKISRKNLPPFGFFHQKGQRGAGPVDAGRQLFVQAQNMLLQILLKYQGIDRVTLVFAASATGPVYVCQCEQWMTMKNTIDFGLKIIGRRGHHSPARTGHT